MSRNNDDTEGIFLDYLSHRIYCKLAGINLSRQKIRVFLNNLI